MIKLSSSIIKYIPVSAPICRKNISHDSNPLTESQKQSKKDCDIWLEENVPIYGPVHLAMACIAVVFVLQALNMPWDRILAMIIFGETREALVWSTCGPIARVLAKTAHAQCRSEGSWHNRNYFSLSIYFFPFYFCSCYQVFKGQHSQIAYKWPWTMTVCYGRTFINVDFEN